METTIEMMKNAGEAVAEKVAEKALSKKEIVAGGALITFAGVGVGMLTREAFKFVKGKISAKKESKDVQTEEAPVEEVETEIVEVEEE